MQEVPARAAPLSVQPLFAAQYSGIEQRRRLVIRDSDTWKAVWGQMVQDLKPQPEIPAIDFSAAMVIVAALGARATGGYSVSIEGAAADKERIYVVVREVSPGRGCLLTQAFTAPVAAVKIPRSHKPVLFIERTEVRDCG